jgi:hypothetical protein
MMQAALEWRELAFPEDGVNKWLIRRTISGVGYEQVRWVSLVLVAGKRQISSDDVVGRSSSGGSKGR